MRKCRVRGYIHELFVSKPEQARYEVRLKRANNSFGAGAFSLGKFFDRTESIFWSRV